MPRIIINEAEEEVMTLLDPTETVVLVPLLCVTGTSTTAKSYAPEDIKTFCSDFRTAVVQQAYTNTLNGVDRSFIYALMLLKYGVNIIVKPLIETTETSVYQEAAITNEVNILINNGALEEFKDKNIFNIKFITTGAHANILRDVSSEGSALSGCYDTLAAIAADRGDCVSLLELESNIICNTDKSSELDIKNVLAGDQETAEKYKFATCVFPWGSYKVTDNVTSYSDLLMPGSFGYLSAFANSNQTNADWYATAGVNRGAIPNLNSVVCEIGESQMHVLLNENETGDKIKFNVNPIMRVSEYGHKIWGNRVACVNNTSESYQDYLNVRLLLCDIKKQIYYAATRVTFEPNDLITWLNFKGLVNELLDEMKSNRGIEWYSWNRQETSAKATIKAILSIKPIEAVEYFDITVNLSSEEAEVTEV